LPIMRPFTRVFPAVQDVPLVPEKTGAARLIAGCGKGKLVGELVGMSCRKLIRLRNC
jgi:hypothetical protein